MAHKLTREEIDYLKQVHGANNLSMDPSGNIIDTKTGMCITDHLGKVVMPNQKAGAKDYFRSLPGPVKQAIMNKVLENEIDEAVERLSTQRTYESHIRDYKLSYEEMAKITAEGILVGDK